MINLDPRPSGRDYIAAALGIDTDGGTPERERTGWWWAFWTALAGQAGATGDAARLGSGEFESAQNVAARSGDVDELDQRSAASDYGTARVVRSLVRARREHLESIRRVNEVNADENRIPQMRGNPETVHRDAERSSLRADHENEVTFAGQVAAYWVLERGDVEGLTRRADAGDDAAAEVLAFWLREYGDVEELIRRADAGDDAAADVLALWLYERGDVKRLTRRADIGDDLASSLLATLLNVRGDVEELRLRADSGDRHAADRLAPTRQVVVDDSEYLDDAHPDPTILNELARRDEVTVILALIYRVGGIEELFRRADSGDEASISVLALMGEPAFIGPLTERADAGDGEAARVVQRVRRWRESGGPTLADLAHEPGRGTGTTDR